VRAIVQPELGWSDERWEAEAARYAQRWREAHSLLPAGVPDLWSARPELVA
jgi:glycerol-3-phosphate dehydrogenase